MARRSILRVSGEIHAGRDYARPKRWALVYSMYTDRDSPHDYTFKLPRSWKRHRAFQYKPQH